jgi:hypothetical protein
MNPDLDSIFNRRAFLNRFGLGLGGIALADLLNSNATAASSAADHGVLRRAAFPGEGEAHHLSVHVGRSVAA